MIRNGAVLTELRAVTSPTIRTRADSQIKMSMSGNFAENELVNFLTDELQAIQIIDGIEYPIGYFVPTTVAYNYGDGTKRLNVEAYDRCWILQNTKTETIVSLAAGTNYIDAVESFLAQANIPVVFATPTTATLQTAREDWDIGTSYLTIINQLLSEINYRDIWFDATGHARLNPVIEPSAENVQHFYDGTNVKSVIMPNCQKALDIYNKPNVFMVICSNPDLPAPLTSTAVNDNPISELSTVRRGRRIAQIFYVDNIADQAALDAYAQKLCNDSILSSETATIYTANMPDHGLYDVVAVNLPNLSGIFQETGWEMQLAAGGQMRHNIRRSILI